MKRDLFYVGNTIWDRANPVKALYGFMERPIADMRMAELTTAETSELGTLFAASPAMLEALTDIRATLLKQADSRYVPTLGDLASMLDKADAALVPFKGAQEVKP